MRIEAVFARHQVSPDLAAKTIRGYRSVFRWGKNVMSPSDRPESLLDHKEADLAIREEMWSRCPAFGEVFKSELVDDYLSIHDAEELVAGDIAISRNDYFEVVGQWKRRSERGFIHLTRVFIEDLGLRNTVRNLRREYANDYEGNPNAILAKHIDKVQAGRFGRENVFNRAHSNEVLAHKHAEFSLGVILKYVPSLLELLPEDAKPSLLDFMRGEVEDYRRVGYPEVAKKGHALLEAMATQEVPQPKAIQPAAT